MELGEEPLLQPTHHTPSHPPRAEEDGVTGDPVPGTPLLTTFLNGSAGQMTGQRKVPRLPARSPVREGQVKVSSPGWGGGVGRAPAVPTAGLGCSWCPKVRAGTGVWRGWGRRWGLDFWVTDSGIPAPELHSPALLSHHTGATRILALSACLQASRGGNLLRAMGWGWGVLCCGESPSRSWLGI